MIFVNLFSLFLWALVFFASTTAVPIASPEYPAGCGANGVSVRLPPPFDAADIINHWTPYPPGWYFKPWNMVYASNRANLALRNFQYDPTPVSSSDLTGTVNDLSSFQIPNNATVFTTYGVDTPAEWSAGFHYPGTGILNGASSDYSMLAWGCDESGTPYYVNHSTYTELTGYPAGIDVMSTKEDGLDQKTLDALVSKLKALGNNEIANMAEGLKKMTNDGGRKGMPRISTCDETCKSNKDLLDILG